jgi:hypothetical protein
MDHDSTREQLELAGLEPGGIDRLIAGDTSTAQAVAAHLAGCQSCTDELARIDRAARFIRRGVREYPPADLRERTLAAVRSAGVQRGAPVAADPSSPPSIGVVSSSSGGRGRSALGWVAAVAAAVVLSVAATSVIVGRQVDERLAGQTTTIEDLEQVTTSMLQLTAEPDTRRVALTGTDPGLAGNLIFSPSTSQLVVVATGLTPPPTGQEYRCWVEQAGQRQRVGKMYFSQDLAYWVGPVPAVTGLVNRATFGVSLVDADGTAVDSEPVLGGDL